MCVCVCVGVCVCVNFLYNNKKTSGDAIEIRMYWGRKILKSHQCELISVRV